MFNNSINKPGKSKGVQNINPVVKKHNNQSVSSHKNPTNDTFAQVTKQPINNKHGTSLRGGILLAQVSGTQKTPVPKIQKDRMQKLIRELHHADFRVRRHAVEALGEIGDKRAVPALISALKDSDGSFNIDVVFALGKIGDKRAVPALISALKYKYNEYVRSYAAEALGKIGDKRAFPALFDALRRNSAYWDVRVNAAIALGKIGERAVSKLISVVKHGTFLVRADAAFALGKIGDKRAVPALISALKDSCVNYAGEALGDIGESAVPALISALKDGDRRVRARAAYALGEIGPAAKSAVPALISVLHRSDGVMNIDVVFALGKIGDKRAVPGLISALKDRAWDATDYSLREEAAEVLGGMGPAAKDAVPALISALKDSKWRVRMNAAYALGKIGDKRAVPALISALKDRSWNVRVAVEEVLEKIQK